MGATLNFIDIWLKLLKGNYESIRVAYITAMKEMFKKKPLTTIKELPPNQKVQKIMTDIGGGFYMEKIAKGLPPSKRSKISKISQEKEDKIK